MIGHRNTPFFINEPRLIDDTLMEHFPDKREPEMEDNVRIYIPSDLNSKAILRRLD